MNIVGGDGTSMERYRIPGPHQYHNKQHPTYLPTLHFHIAEPDPELQQHQRRENSDRPLHLSEHLRTNEGTVIVAERCV